MILTGTDKGVSVNILFLVIHLYILGMIDLSNQGKNHNKRSEGELLIYEILEKIRFKIIIVI